MSAGELIANQVLDELNIIDPSDLQLLDKIVWARNALVREAPLGGSEARLTYAKTGRSVITISSLTSSEQRKRFSIAHELGHLEVHSNSGLLRLCGKDDISYRKGVTSKDIEDEANEFAAAFLLPSRFVATRFTNNDPSLELIQEISEDFNTSLTSTALRLLDFSEEPIAVVFSQDEVIKWFQANEEFMETGAFVDVRAKVRKPSGAARFFQMGEIPKGWRNASAFTWLKERNYKDDAKIKENSVAMPNYGAVLTLLWAPDDLYDGDDDDFLFL